MPLEPPDPHTIAAVLRVQLDQLRQLVAENPREPAYAKAADHVASAIATLDSTAASQAAP